MNSKLSYTALVLLFCLLSLGGFAQEISMTINSETAVYKKGEAIIIKASVSGEATDSLHISILRNHIHPICEKSYAVTNGEITVFEGSYDEACSIIVNARCGKGKSAIGCVVAPEDFKPGFKRPKDLNKYWKNLKKELYALPYEVKKEQVEIPNGNGEYECFDMEINCLGAKPVRGYYAKPANAKEKSLPIIILVRAAGVKGDWCKSNIKEVVGNAQKGNGALSLDINAHGMLNAQEDKYYEDLENGELKNYWLSGIENRDTYYFRDMYLRVLRAIDYMAQQPEWDGKRILIMGESQGGGQSLAAAALDKRVSAAVVTVPALCDFGGALVDRRSGWPQPIESTKKDDDILNALPYTDASLLLKGCKATIVAEIGFIDQTCPCSSIYAALNQTSGKKIIYGVTYRTHAWPEPPHRAEWDKTVNKYKSDFVENYLK